MGMVGTLDSNYVWLHDPRFSTGLKPGKASELELGRDGRATAPGFARGMRAMFVTTGGGARFTPAGAPPEFRGSDMISIDSPDTATFVDEIAHEATHATDFVSGSAPSGKTVADEIKAGIQLEIHARENEAQVLKEIPGKDIKAKSKEVGSRDVPEVERQVAEGLGATYLETAFFTRELHDAQVAEKLDETQAGKIRAEIDDLFGSVILKPSPGYGQIWFEWKKVIRDWTEFNQTHSPTDSTFIADREKMVQAHAKRYFKGKVAYTPFPPSKP